MSAILGIFQRDLKPLSGHDLENMSQALSHRGKDGSGLWMKNSVGLGHQMRWITPESLTEKLPYYDKYRKLAITADARIDNRQQLFSRLAIKKDLQHTISDSELILLSYARWGEQCVDYLLGDFVFAIWDQNNRKLFCATDPMGMRPVYYYLDDRVFVFSSEIRALLTLDNVPKKLNEIQFARNLVYELSLHESEQTCFKNVFLLTSGKTITVEQDKIRFANYGKTEFKKKLYLKTEAEYLEAFREIFDEAVLCRMRSAYPVSCLLSGGLDSSAIAAVAAKKLQHENTRLHAISRVLPHDHKGPEQDERYYMQLVRDQWDINIHYVSPAGSGVYEGLEQEMFRAGHPFIDARHYQHREFQKTAEQIGARVILDGYGGETSASAYGTGYLAELILRGRWLHLTKEIAQLKKVERKKYSSLVYNHLIRPFVPAWLVNLKERQKYGISPGLAKSPIRKSFCMATGIDTQLRNTRKSLETSPGLLANELRTLDLDKGETHRLFNPNHSMVLYPYLDKRVLEFCLSLPGHLKISHGWRRYLIRAAMNGMLPTEVQWRLTKNPFSPDHPTRVKSGEAFAGRILKEVQDRDMISQYIDLPRLRQLQRELSGQEEYSFNDVYDLNGKASIVQRGVYAIVFSKVFNELFQ